MPISVSQRLADGIFDKMLTWRHCAAATFDERKPGPAPALLSTAGREHTARRRAEARFIYDIDVLKSIEIKSAR